MLVLKILSSQSTDHFVWTVCTDIPLLQGIPRRLHLHENDGEADIFVPCLNIVDVERTNRLLRSCKSLKGLQ
jgi:hypothetical protein